MSSTNIGYGNTVPYILDFKAYKSLFKEAEGLTDMDTNVPGKRKKILIAVCAAAAILLIFLGYPLVIHAINYPAIAKEKNRVTEKIESFGHEVYSSKVFLSTEMEYRGGYRILYYTEYVIIFQSDKNIDELYEEMPSLMMCPLDEAGLWGWGEEEIKSAKLPDETDGYYAAYFSYRTTVSETAGTKLHTFIYADKENRRDINEEIEFFK